MADSKVTALTEASSCELNDMFYVVDVSENTTGSRKISCANATALKVYADATARDAAITSPVAGQTIYNTARSATQTYTGSAWITPKSLIDVYADATARDAAITSPAAGQAIYNTATRMQEIYDDDAGLWQPGAAAIYVPPSGDTTGVEDSDNIDAALAEAANPASSHYQQAVVLTGGKYEFARQIILGNPADRNVAPQCLTSVGTAVMWYVGDALTDDYFISVHGYRWGYHPILSNLIIRCKYLCRGVHLDYQNYHALFENLHIVCTIEEGIHADDCWGAVFRNIRLTSCRGFAMYLTDANNVTLDKITITSGRSLYSTDPVSGKEDVDLANEAMTAAGGEADVLAAHAYAEQAWPSELPSYYRGGLFVLGSSVCITDFNCESSYYLDYPVINTLTRDMIIDGIYLEANKNITEKIYLRGVAQAGTTMPFGANNCIRNAYCSDGADGGGYVVDPNTDCDCLIRCHYQSNDCSFTQISARGITTSMIIYDGGTHDGNILQGLRTYLPDDQPDYSFNSTGVIKKSPVEIYTMLDTYAQNSSIYHSSDEGALAYKDSAGTVIELGAFTVYSNPDPGVSAATAVEAFGDDACVALETGANNTSAFGYEALLALTTGANNTAFGMHAGYAITTGANNVIVGISATSLTTGSLNVAVGASSLAYNESGSNNVAIGYAAGLGDPGLSDFDYSVLIGYQAGLSLLSAADGTVAIGRDALKECTSGLYNVGIGSYAGRGITTGIGNIILGTAGGEITTGSHNFVLGTNALAYNRTGIGNIAIGSGAGLGALAASDFGFSILLGFEAGTAMLTAAVNTIAIGKQALTTCTSGVANIAIGYRSGAAVTTGSNNVLLGYESGDNLTTGSNNTLLGDMAGDNLTTGDRNIIIGDGVDVSAVGVNDELNIGDLITGDTSATQKLGFYDAGAVVQAAHIANPTNEATNITAINAILVVLENLGLTASS